MLRSGKKSQTVESFVVGSYNLVSESTPLETAIRSRFYFSVDGAGASDGGGYHANADANEVVCRYEPCSERHVPRLKREEIMKMPL